MFVPVEYRVNSVCGVACVCVRGGWGGGVEVGKLD